MRAPTARPAVDPATRATAAPPTARPATSPAPTPPKTAAATRTQHSATNATSEEPSEAAIRQASAQAIRERLAQRIGRTGVSGANEQGTSGTRNPASIAPAVAAFYSHVRDVYHRAWRQPVTQNTGHTAILKIRLSRDGTILHSTLVSPSGNAAMDESVRAAARAVTRLGRSLPDELAGETVEVSVTFEY